MNFDPMEGKLQSERRRERDKLISVIESDVRDWFTLAPTYRTKEKLIRMIRASLGDQ